MEYTRVGTLNVAPNQIRFSPSTIESHAPVQTANTLEEERPAASDFETHVLPQLNVRAGKSKTFTNYTNNCCQVGVDFNHAANGVTAAAETPLP